SDPLHADLCQILIGANRAKDLVQQILIFSRQAEQERKPLKLHLIIKESIQLLRSSIPSTIKIRRRIDSSCKEILADPAQMQQVFVNLCANSFHAMEQKGGVLTVELKQVEIDAVTAQSHPTLQQKEYVRLTVNDTGAGMDNAVTERIFEPFYTTKSVGKGTGLGLSMVHGIVRSHHGDIVVYSEPGKGSTFHVYLPIITTGKETVEIEVQSIQMGREHILIVDDEEIITRVLKRMLEQFGYKIEVRNSSIEAIEVF
ncbi:MAG: peptidylprolyl isomerase, partial [Planctomycetes bacterium]|nr:peptidylprolyl isomerase [Planctomycetota bacterium]